VARGLSDQQRRGLVFNPAWQRTIVVTFGSIEEAEAWDELSEAEAFAVLAQAAQAREDSDKEDDTT
jgi:hypothetical protein